MGPHIFARWRLLPRMAGRGNAGQIGSLTSCIRACFTFWQDGPGCPCPVRVWGSRSRSHGLGPGLARLGRREATQVLVAWKNHETAPLLDPDPTNPHLVVSNGTNTWERALAGYVNEQHRPTRPQNRTEASPYICTCMQRGFADDGRQGHGPRHCSSHRHAPACTNRIAGGYSWMYGVRYSTRPCVECNRPLS